jgi:hypothetical protein
MEPRLGSKLDYYPIIGGTAPRFIPALPIVRVSNAGGVSSIIETDHYPNLKRRRRFIKYYVRYIDFGLGKSWIK